MSIYGRGILEVRVDRYDGQTVWCKNEPLYELGNYLGSGAAGAVYEAFHVSTQQHVALKILNPIGFKLLPSGSLQRYFVAVKGKTLDLKSAAGPGAARNDASWGRNNPYHSHARNQFGVHNRAGNVSSVPMSAEHVWWLVHPSTKQVVAAFEDQQYGGLRELPLPRCVEIWGWNPPEADERRDRDGGANTNTNTNTNGSFARGGGKQRGSSL